MEDITYKKVSYAYLNLDFDGIFTTPAITNQSIVYPNVWIWCQEHSTLPLLYGPYDFRILSVGTMNWYVKSYDIKVSVGPSNCSMDFNKFDTLVKIASSLRTMVNFTRTKTGKTLKLDKPNAFCNFVKIPTQTSIMESYMLGWNRYRMSGFQCCVERPTGKIGKGKHFEKSKEIYDCSRRVSKSGWLSFIQVISFISFLYAPLLLQFFPDSQRPSTFTLQTSRRVLSRNNGREHENGQNWSGLWLSDPTTYFLTYFKLTNNGRQRQIWLSRAWRLVLFWFLIPSILILRITLYYYLKRKTLEKRLHAGIPIGFLAIPFGFERSLENWKYWMGGPYVVLLLYASLSVLFFCLPNISDILMWNFAKSHHRAKRYFVFSQCLTMVNGFGYVDFSKYYGLKFVGLIILGRIYAIINPEFWLYFLLVWKLRIKRLMRWASNPIASAPKWLTTILYVPLIFLTIIPVAIEFFITVVYFGLPLLYLLKVLICSYIGRVWQYLTSDSKTSACPFRNVFGVLAAFLITMTLLVYTYIFGMIYVTSTSWIFFLLDQTFVGLVIYPHEALGYVSVVSSVVFYTYHSIHGLVTGHATLFDLTLQACKRIKRNHSTQHHAQDSRTNPNRQNRIQSTYGTFSSDFDNLIRSKGRILYIPQELFKRVLGKLRPLRREVLKSGLKLAVMIFFLVVVILVTNDYNRQEELYAIPQLIGIIVVGTLPQTMQIVCSCCKSHVRKLKMQQKVEDIVEEWWEMEKVRSTMTESDSDDEELGENGLLHGSKRSVRLRLYSQSF
ncbi:uncharacterized protein LOC112042193 [Lingula anatina]|uniref:Uncharacterized protein LOC112042193 n=1 Tax=Lingula anatina TaxID=7574 RepID=A0A2R2MPG3_LINAN|nr:uncharacterized protein LOC112042193 [Lingula anatina]|eukprot:XP_023932068.1 uncharacterized protein LOC112042193 [Lingula anatina]